MTNTPQNYQLVCGLEVHAELKTASKMFCGCKNDPFGAPAPNTYTCPTCLGMPGGLPLPNQKAIEWTLKLGLALNCQTNLFSKFDRKNYFYPDLPKGYQISQYDIPFCYDGYLDTSQGRVRIRRIHLEEDTGKLQHTTLEGESVSLVDFNRGGVPLIEIVTEPDIKNPEQAKEYGRKLRQIMRYLDIADCDMEQGGMRLEANISLKQPDATELPAYKVEVKNINSFRFLEQAITFEIKRQSEILAKDETPTQETRGWNPSRGVTFAQRTKEEAEDYRYFPDPDIPPIRFTTEQLEQIKSEIKELPAAVVARWQAEFLIEAKYGELLSLERPEMEKYDKLFTEAKKTQLDTNKLANLIANKKLTLQSDHQQTLAAFKEMTQATQVDTDKLATIIDDIMTAFPDESSRFLGGEDKLANFFMGQIMRQHKGLDAQQIRAALLERLK